MDIEFDPAKDRFDYGEVRFVAMGLIDDRLYVLIFAQGSHETQFARSVCDRPKSMR